MEFSDIKKIINTDADLCESKLSELLGISYIGNGKLQDAMRYASLGGGKKIRACLALEFCKVFSGNFEKALCSAAAIEMIHAYSLIHDDLPCMDDDDMRRGKPSCHAAFGEATALLAGDALLTYSTEVISSAKEISERVKVKILNCFSKCAGTLGMAGGQMIDLDCNIKSYAELVNLHSMKTGALIKAAIYSGYISACDGNTDAACLEDLSVYAESVGLAFQIKDDLLDLEGDANVLGKKTGIDGENGRINALSFFSPDEAKSECERLAEVAENSIKKYPNSEFLSLLPEYLNGRNK